MVNSEKLPESFYLRENVTQLAHELLGKSLWTDINGKISAGMIVETEAYSFREKACHAYGSKRTRRTETLFARGGTAYVYLCYGIHHLFNVVTNREGVAEAVLIRAVEPVYGQDEISSRRGKMPRHQMTSGPGKLSAGLGITTEKNGISLLGDEIWISEGRKVSQHEVIADARIGVGYAGEDASLPWRFFLRDNPYVSVTSKNLNLS